MKKPFFIITIDTEGDNLWSKPTSITTENAKFIPRFQKLCEINGLKPTYLVNFEMATNLYFQKFLKQLLREKVAEIGLHIHSWNSPPIVNLTPNDNRYHPYLIEFDELVIEQKASFLSDYIQNIAQEKLVSHRAGRWALNEKYLSILNKLGYFVDCSVTPYVSWTNILGAPNGLGGTDYSKYPTIPYFMDLNDISKEGSSSFLQVPVTILPAGYLEPLLERGKDKPAWLRPNGKNLDQMKLILEYAVMHSYDCVEFMLHSSELMPGGSPTFKADEDIEKLYKDLSDLFTLARTMFSGTTLKEYYQFKCETRIDSRCT